MGENRAVVGGVTDVRSHQCGWIGGLANRRTLEIVLKTERPPGSAPSRNAPVRGIVAAAGVTDVISQCGWADWRIGGRQSLNKTTVYK